MRMVLDLAAQVASSSATILVTGESGAGKEVVAGYCDPEQRDKVHRTRKAAYVDVCHRIIDLTNRAKAEEFYQPAAEA